MGTGLTNLTDVMYCVLDEDGNPQGEPQKMGEAIEATISYDEPLLSNDERRFVDWFAPMEFTGEIILQEPWLVFGHPYEDKLFASVRMSQFFKKISLPRMAIYKMAEGMEKLEQVRKQESRIRWDSIRQHSRERLLSIFKR